MRGIYHMSSQPVRISVVSYLNAKPFVHGLEAGLLDGLAEISLDIPSVCARKLINGEVDLGLVPVAVIPQIPNAQVVSNFCIGANGPVQTVSIFSDVPINEIKSLYLDYQSRTSVKLAQLLLARHWKVNPVLLEASEGFESKIKGTTAGLVIGDRAFALNQQYAYIYDLSAAWKQFTGLPFVFAAWVANKPLHPVFLDLFESSLAIGVERIELVAQFEEMQYPGIDLKQYYSKYIHYTLDDAKRQAMHLFLNNEW